MGDRLDAFNTVPFRLDSAGKDDTKDFARAGLWKVGTGGDFVRTRSNPRFLVIFALGLLVFALAACSDDDEGPAEPVPITSEGTADGPVPLTVDDGRSSQVGAGAESISYYRFRTNVSGLYTIGMTDAASNLSWQLHTAGGFGDPPLETCDGSTDDSFEACIVFLDDARTIYDLAVVNLGSAATNFRLFVNGAGTGAPTGCGSTSDACYDFEDGQVPDSPIIFTMSGDADWFIDDADATRDGQFSLRSGAILDGQTTCFEFVAPDETNVIGFNWMCQSEDGGDFLVLYADGVELKRFSGTEAWNSWSRSGGAAMDVVYKLCYEKNGSVSVSEDAAWLDDLFVE